MSTAPMLAGIARARLVMHVVAGIEESEGCFGRVVDLPRLQGSHANGEGFEHFAK